jgi:predicted ATP-grasp superfamily ATP-dependent carboligase
LTLPHPRRDPDGFLRGLEITLEQDRHDILLPSSDVTTWLISENRERFEGLVRIAIPDRDAVRASLDKSRLIREAPTVGLAAPASTVCNGVDDGLAAVHALGLPVIFKSVRSFVPRGTGFEQMSVTLVTEPEQLDAALTRHEAPFIVQRYVRSGNVVSCSGVMTSDGLLGFAVVRWQRRWPVSEGATSYCRTIAPPAGLAARVEQLLRGLRFWGVFELELLETAEGELLAIDLNPRLFGWLSLPIAAGANLPAMLCDWLTDRHPSPAAATPGVYYRWEDADFRHFLWQFHNGNFKSALAVLRPRRRVVHPHFSLKDPGPLLARLLLIVRTRFRRRRTPSPVAALRPETTRTGAPV